jgi:hypothetical protein
MGQIRPVGICNDWGDFLDYGDYPADLKEAEYGSLQICARGGPLRRRDALKMAGKLMIGSRTRIGVILVALAFSLSGCCVHRCGVAPDLAIGGACDSCGSSCDGDCGEPVVDDCGDACGDPCSPCHGGWFSPIMYMLGCGSGCGEVYWDEWISDPPECCDPCDNCGNWIGQPDWCRWHGSPLHRRNLWGARHATKSETYTDSWHDGEVVIDEQWSDEMVAPDAAGDAQEAAPKVQQPPPSDPPQGPKSAQSRSVLRSNAARPRPSPARSR